MSAVISRLAPYVDAYGLFFKKSVLRNSREVSVLVVCGSLFFGYIPFFGIDPENLKNLF